MTTKARTAEDWLLVPFTIICDSSEGHPWTFTGLRGDSDQKYRELIVPTRVQKLKTGDYTVAGFEAQMTIERKSLDDAFNTFIHERGRFERQLARQQEMDFSAVIIEAGWGTILNYKPPDRDWNPKTIYRSIVAWQTRFTKVHWWACETRSFAERTAFRLMQRFWLDVKEGKRTV